MIVDITNGECGVGDGEHTLGAVQVLGAEKGVVEVVMEVVRSERRLCWLTASLLSCLTVSHAKTCCLLFHVSL